MKKATSSQHESQEFLRKRRKEKEVFVGEECSFKAILNSFLLPGGTFCQIWYWETVQKCISWILPIISNEPFMTQDELRAWKILHALQIMLLARKKGSTVISNIWGKSGIFYSTEEQNWL